MSDNEGLNTLTSEIAKSISITDALEDLLLQAEKYGRVGFYSDRSAPLPNKYSVHIEFECIAGVQLEARSDFRMPIKEAFYLAIERAKEIVKNVKKLPD